MALDSFFAARFRGSVVLPRCAAFVLISALALSACATTELTPLTPAANGEGLARSESVELRAQVRPARQELPPEFRPIEIVVTNLAPEGISVELADIELVTRRGVIEPVPPEAVRLRRPLGLGIDPASPLAAPNAASSAAAASGSARPAGGPVSEPTTTYLGGPSADPKRRELVDDAFAGGFIESGETERGLVYFDFDQLDGNRVTLRVVVRAASGSAPAETLEIPFSVES